MTNAEREALGRVVREAWVAWAREQPTPKTSWLLPWEALSEPDREVDRRIGEAIRARVLADLAATVGGRPLNETWGMADLFAEIAALRAALAAAREKIARLTAERDEAKR